MYQLFTCINYGCTKFSDDPSLAEEDGWGVGQRSLNKDFVVKTEIYNANLPTEDDIISDKQRILKFFYLPLLFYCSYPLKNEVRS